MSDSQLQKMKDRLAGVAAGAASVAGGQTSKKGGWPTLADLRAMSDDQLQKLNEGLAAGKELTAEEVEVQKRAAAEAVKQRVGRGDLLGRT